MVFICRSTPFFTMYFVRPLSVRACVRARTVFCTALLNHSTYYRARPETFSLQATT